MAVGAHEAVGEGRRLSADLPRHDHRGQVFEVDLMDNAGGRRNHAEVGESVLPPAEELVALEVAAEFQIHVDA